MEFQVSSKPLKPNSNISEIVSRFAKVCKLRSIGVLNTSENGDTHLCNGPSLPEESCSDATTEDADFDAVKIHPNPTEVQSKVSECGHMEILKLFDTLLALKLAYVKLQEAHIPYDPEKIRAADEEVVSHLESLCKTKKAYNEKILNDVNSVSALLLAEIQVQERSLEKLKSKAKNKDKEVVNFRVELRDLETRNKKMVEEIREQEKEIFKGLTHYSFEDVVKEVRRAIHDFSKPLIALMKVSDWDLDKAVNEIQNSVVYTKRSHKKYAFEAFIARRMFHGFSPQSCDLENIMKLEDPIDALIEDPQSSFAKFCKAKYLLIVHPKMEASFFGNLDHRTLVSNGIHPYTPFYRAFVKMAKWVWFLQGFTSFTDPKVEIFGVKQGSEFSDVYMEVPEELKECKARHVQKRCKVEFMISPGFIRGETLIRSQVYASKMGF
ncbi:hypothetical protein ACJIZ3_017829 [Penstemon smallii]|uniref:DUF641 domain-containing protein n=1 Tax=Penstemon smallii TaxID=265156 RepID=A0ABD3SXY5_9LAMI